MKGRNTAVFGLYPSRQSVEEAIEHLRANGFRGTDISVLLPETTGTKDIGHEKGSKAAEGAARGAVAGGLTGGAIGWLTSAGILAIPELRQFVAAGPIVGALAGAGAAGTIGAIVGALVGWGVPEYEAVRYEGRIRDSSMLLSVHCDNVHWVKRAKESLLHTGGLDIGVAAERPGDFANADRPMPRVLTAAGDGAPMERPLEEDEWPVARTTPEDKVA